MKERQKSNSIFKFSKICNNFSHSGITIFTTSHKVMLNLLQHPKSSSGFRNKFGMTLPLLIILFSMVIEVSAIGTAFTYQGKLTDGGNPANNSYDFQFKLFNAETVGEQIPLIVMRGIFQIQVRMELT